MANSSREKNLEEAYADLSLDNDDGGGLILEDIPDNAVKEDFNRWLVGRFLTNRKVNFMAMQDTLSSIWRPVKGVFMEETNWPNTFLFKFFHDLDMQRVLKDGPWTFNQQVLLVKQLNMDEQLKDVKLSELYIWVQVYDVPIGFNSEHVLKSIGNYVGRYMESNPKNLQGMCRSYLRIRVAIDILRPLKSKMRIKKAGGDWLWIQFKYERLPSFCFFCGLIGHSEKFCEALFDNPQGHESRKYDSSLRAQMRNQGTSKENQWLRGADGGAVTQPRFQEKDEEGSIEAVNVGHNHRGNQRDIRENELLVDFNREQDGIEENSNYDDVAIKDGIIITKQKRQRTKEGNVDLGLLTNSNDGLDIVMGEEIQRNQKNLTLAGPVTQARPSQ